jgi:FlaA1/EpsC-like NDP-sugar epimerase
MLILLAAYASSISLSWWLSYQLRFDFNVPLVDHFQAERHWLWVLLLKLVLLAAGQQFSGLMRYFSIPDMVRLAVAIGISAIILFASRFVLGADLIIPRGVVLIDAVLTFGSIVTLRLGYRVWRNRRAGTVGRSSQNQRHVAIIGAGDVGASLMQELAARPAMGLKAVVFLDDDATKWGSSLHGLPIEGPLDKLETLAEKYALHEIIIAMPSASAKRIGALSSLAQKLELNCVTVPGIDQLTSGKVTLNQLRPVSVEDLLGRDEIVLDNATIRSMFAGRVIMVTGAGGSIGSELCRQIAALHPERLLLVEQSEVQLFQIEQEMILRGYRQIIVPLVADILDQPRISGILKKFKPAVICHAAAHKHVPMMECQPGEAIKNNSLGTARLAEMAIAYNVERFLMISTDKAVNPTNIMGASKRLAEIYLQSRYASAPQKTRFICVRFGNVLGSSGSVVPTFTRQIAAGGPVTVTHPDMVRYFMTIPEAVGLVLQSCAQGVGGEIFVLDMGKPVKIADLARQMIALSGLRPDHDIEVKYVGLRPGEKLFEELSCTGEKFLPTRHPRIMSFQFTPAPFQSVCTDFQKLEQDLHELEPEALKKRVQQLVPEYVPSIN